MRLLISLILALTSFTVIAQRDKTYYSITDAWKDPVNVYKLELRKDGLNSFPKEIFYMVNLEELYLEKNSIAKIPKEINQLKKLRILDLDQNLIDSVPAEIGELVNLVELDLDQNKLVFLPNEIGKLKRLRSLDLHQNRLTKLPIELSDLDSLNELKLENNLLKGLPDFSKMSSLIHLSANNNLIAKFPTGLEGCVKLRFIDFSHNKIDSLPDFFPVLPSAQQLFLDNNQLANLPKQMHLMPELIYATFNNNKISVFPSGWQLSGLTNLYMDYNKISAIPDSLSGLENLKAFSISNNLIQTIPPGISHLKNIYDLGLANNKLTSLPNEISQLKTLRELDLRNNQLTTLPESFYELNGLVKLDLIHNLFDKKLKGFEKLSNLQHLSITNEQRKFLPDKIQNLEHLNSICIQMNGDGCISYMSNRKAEKVHSYAITHDPEPEPEPKIDLTKKGWMDYLVHNISISRFTTDHFFDEDRNFELSRQLNHVADDADLIALLDHEDATVRTVAFDLLDARKNPMIFEFVKKHLEDKIEETSHNNWNFTYSLGNHYVKARSFSPKQRYIIDSLILTKKYFYPENERIFTTYDTISNLHSLTLQFAATDPRAAMYLAKFNRESDLDTLIEILKKYPYSNYGIPEIFHHDRFVEAMDDIFNAGKHANNQYGALLNYETEKSMALIKKMVETDIRIGKNGYSNLTWALRELEYNKSSYFDTIYSMVWRNVMEYPDSIFLDRLLKSQPVSTIHHLKKLIDSLPQTYYDEKLMYCLETLYTADSSWALEKFTSKIITYMKHAQPYDYTSEEPNLSDFAKKHPHPVFAEMYIKIHTTNTRSLMDDVELVNYILPFRDPILNNSLMRTLVDFPHIFDWDADLIKTELKKYGVLNDFIAEQKKRKPTPLGNWRIVKMTYQDTSYKSPSWSYLELGTKGVYLLPTCTSKMIGEFHLGQNSVIFDTIAESVRNWADTYVDINAKYHYIAPTLAMSAMPALIDVCRDTTFTSDEVNKYLNALDEILQGEMSFELMDSTLILKGNGELHLKLLYNYLTDWTTPAKEPEKSDFDPYHYEYKYSFLKNPPSSIGGISIQKYLARNDIDSLSKLFIQGKYGLISESYEDNRYLLDSIHTDNPDTRAFYFYQLNRIIGIAKTDFHYYSQLRDDLSRHCSNFFINDPCYFFQMVKSGPYAYNYMEWKKYLQRGLWNNDSGDIQKLGTEYKLKNNCSKYMSEFKALIKWMEDYYDPEIPVYDED